MSSHLDRIEDWPSLAHATRYSADLLAKTCLISQRQLERHWALRFHQPPQAWLDELRMEEACRRLLRREYVKCIAVDLGFRDAAHFCHVFKRRFGVSPMRYIAAREPPSIAGKVSPLETAEAQPGSPADHSEENVAHRQ